jgi:hypothetical protein
MIIQAIKVWWDGEKLMTETIDPAAMYSDIVSDGGLDPRNKFDTPLQRQWVGLTLKEIQELAEKDHGAFHPVDLSLAVAIEAKLKEKNT